MAQQENDGFKQTTASGGEVNIPFDFKISDRAEIKLVRTRSGVSTTLVLDTDYTIADNQLNVDLGGVMVLIGASNPAQAADVYTTLLVTPYSRGTLNLSSDFNQAGDFFANTLNTQFDYIVRMINRLARDTGKSLKFAETLDIPTATITSAPVDGNLLAFQGVGGNVVPVSLASLAITGLDTIFTSLASGDSLVYNGINWVNRKLLGAKGTPIASASTTDLGAANSDFVDVTGTTTITSLGATTTRNHIWVNFTGALTLTHNATSLILPGAANITTAAGDIAEFIRISGSNWKCVSYIKADGTSVAGVPDGTITFAKLAAAAIATTAEILAGTASKLVSAANLAPLFQSVKCTKSTTQGITISSWFAVQWDVEMWKDLASMHNNVTNNTRLVAAVAGRYRIISQVPTSNGGNKTNAVRVTKNGAYAAGLPAINTNTTGSININGAGTWPGQVVGIIDMAANDYLEVEIQTNIASENILAEAWATFERIR